MAQGQAIDRKSTGFSAGQEDEDLANVIARRLELRLVRKGKGKGWTPIIRYALQKAADEGTFLASLEQHYAERERQASERFRLVSAELLKLKHKEVIEAIPGVRGSKS